MPVLSRVCFKPAACACLRLSLGFAVAYAISNHLTGLRADVGRAVFDWEHAVPFLPWTVVPYLSIVPLFLLSFFVGWERREHDRHVLRLWLVLAMSIACYMAFPLQFTLARPCTSGLAGLLFDLLGTLDRPYNRAPSLHIGVLVLLWVRWRACLQGWRWLLLKAWFALIAMSVLTTYQHHVIDIPAGVAVALLAVALTTPRAPAPWRPAATRFARAFRPPP